MMNQMLNPFCFIPCFDVCMSLMCLFDLKQVHLINKKLLFVLYFISLCLPGLGTCSHHNFSVCLSGKNIKSFKMFHLLLNVPTFLILHDVMN